MKISIEAEYFEHEGGTKFYEVIQLHHTDKKKWILVKRWGKRGALGELQYEVHPSMRACNASAEKLVKSKRGRGYIPTVTPYGLHGRIRSMTEAELFTALKNHYVNATTASDLAAQLDIYMISGTEISGVWMDEASDIVSEEPRPEPDRGETWASW